MTFEEFNKLPVGTKIKFSGLILEKLKDNSYTDNVSTLIFNDTEYIHKYAGYKAKNYVSKFSDTIKIITILNSPQSLKEKIQKLSQEIDTKTEEKYKLEMELENLLRTEREYILKNLIPDEWYKIQHVRGSFNTVKFIEVKSSGVGFGEVVTGMSVNKSPFYIAISDIKTIEHIKGAKEAEENFRKMLEE